MKEKINTPINVIGHTNPDTDSLCSAIAYAYLKRKVTGENYVPKRAGQINAESKFVLEYFKVGIPDYLGDVRTQVMDIDVNRVPGVAGHISLKNAWKIMKEDMLQTLPIVDDEGYLTGLITVEDIAKSYMDVYDSCVIANSWTPFRNIVETLNGEMLNGDIDERVSSGKCLIAAANPDLMESYIEKDDIVILGNRYESQLCAIEMGARCIIVCDGAKVSFTISKLAEENGCFIIRTPYDTFTASRMIHQSIPIGFFMKQKHLVTFGRGEFLDDIRETMTKKRYRDFPILDWNGKYFGMISRRSLLGARKKKLILVDHNEPTQAVDGIEEAQIMEIIDHHRIGSIETMGPVFFRNQPLGCTATIIFQMFQEYNVKIPQKIAGLLCSAILSDTLIFRSPTCTQVDKDAAEKLSEIAGIVPEEYAAKMFQAGSNLSVKSPEEIFYQDFKKFELGDITLGVGQINSMTSKELEAIKDKMNPYLQKALSEHEVEMIYFMLTDIMEESTELLCAGNGARELALQAFSLPQDTEQIVLKHTVSRKKQVIPALLIALQEE
ncbi:putative manganese-dependent inorganic diphosphatase [bacterium 1xD8-6]|jgi:Inorganic pyrophosphatase/exopolyphosphatase|nr:putative manganese-dependent inorganic diphosphatase [bacterium D16-36]RKI63157.1 putative manganese-dependent inorganic diphosphatase [bacterium 1xD8-6]